MTAQGKMPVRGTMPAKLLDYADASSDDTVPNRPTGTATVLVLLLAATALVTCVRIEWLNAKAGGILPRTGPEKWRVGMFDINAALRDVVGSWGLGQYPIVILGFCLAIVVAFGPWRPRSHRIVGVAGLMVFIATGAIALHRSYFSSLGW